MKKYRVLIFGWVALLCVPVPGCKAHEGDLRRSIVRVVTSDGQPRGTGFFVRGPDGDENVYVATAYHVIASGHALTIQRNADVQDDRSYIESYPETEVVVTDAKNDLAIIAVKNLPLAKVTPLPLAERPNRGEPVKAFGFPTSSLIASVVVQDKDGKLAAFEGLTSYDTLLPETPVEANAIKGVIVDAQIMPGFSGGPTCNLAGEVIGVNIRRDSKLPEQSALVHVDVLRELVGKIRPYQPPTKEDAQRQLKQLRDEVLTAASGQRKLIMLETQFLSPSDLPMTWTWFTDKFSDVERSDPAGFGLFFATLPGEVLPTYWAEDTKKDVESCRRRDDRQRISMMAANTSDAELHRSCEAKRLRSLLWDLTAATLHWDSREPVGEYVVHTFEPIGNDKKLFRAGVSSGSGEAFLVYFAWDHGGLRVKLWEQGEDSQNLYAFASKQRREPQFFSGPWVAQKKVELSGPGHTAETREKVDLSIDDDHKRVKVRHRVDVRVDGGDETFACNGKHALVGGYTQWFEGTYEGGIVKAIHSKDPVADGDCSKHQRAVCNCPEYPTQAQLMFKPRKAELMMYRTDGASAPTEIEFQRDA